jgi:D-beta-D-heptose 7-phosphate kinase/D-beta-D-heptose 1-phosphate adenosyltransferase
MKLRGRKSLKQLLLKLKKSGKKIVFTNGCFDIIHAGHVKLFEKAKSLGDILIVGINSDASLKRLKGPKRPLVPQAERAYVISALKAVDFVAVFGEDTPAEIIKELGPDILVKGGDYKIDEIVGRQYVKKVVRVPLLKGHSTSGLIKKIAERYSAC